jgi:CRISPR-associated endonuclease/helicase Cas3
LINDMEPVKIDAQKNIGKKWIDNLSFYARPILVYSDYIASSNKKRNKKSSNCVFANTDKYDDGINFADSLDIHLVKVGKKSEKLFDTFLNLDTEFEGDILDLKSSETRDRLSMIGKNTPERFKWQDDAVKAINNCDDIKESPAFIAITSGTGSGKTIGSVKIINAASKKLRFSLCQGMRSLTMQCYNAYLDLGIKKSDISLLIGNLEVTKKFNFFDNGSSCFEEIDDIDNVVVGGKNNKKIQSRDLDVLSKKSKDKNLIKSPVCVMTIDHIMRSVDLSKSVNTTNMLRVMSSDLIIDEIDDYDTLSIMNIALLVYLAGFWGNKVIISSATMSSLIVKELYTFYKDGLDNSFVYSSKKLFAGFIGDKHVCFLDIDCIDELSTFNSFYDTNLSKSINMLVHDNRRKAETLSIDESNSREDAFDNISNSIDILHNNNSFKYDGLNISIGFVKFNNVIPCQQFSQKILSDQPDDRRVICYHSKLSQVDRMLVEFFLDKNLQRKCDNYKNGSLLGSEKIIKNKFVLNAIKEIKKAGKKDLKIIISSTNILEVGRDHDYDWAIMEPSSTKGIIQAKGRVRRHRNGEPQSKTNILILNKPIKAIESREGAFSNFGIETDKYNSKPIFPLTKSEIGSDYVCDVSDVFGESIFSPDKNTLKPIESYLDCRMQFREEERIKFYLSENKVNNSIKHLHKIREIPYFKMCSSWYKCNRFRNMTGKEITLSSGDFYDIDSNVSFKSMEELKQYPSFYFKREVNNNYFLLSYKLESAFNYFMKEYDITLDDFLKISYIKVGKELAEKEKIFYNEGIGVLRKF